MTSLRSKNHYNEDILAARALVACQLPNHRIGTHTAPANNSNCHLSASRYNYPTPSIPHPKTEAKNPHFGVRRGAKGVHSCSNGNSRRFMAVFGSSDAWKNAVSDRWNLLGKYCIQRGGVYHLRRTDKQFYWQSQKGLRGYPEAFSVGYRVYGQRRSSGSN